MMCACSCVYICVRWLHIDWELNLNSSGKCGLIEEAGRQIPLKLQRAPVRQLVSQCLFFNSYLCVCERVLKNCSPHAPRGCNISVSDQGRYNVNVINKQCDNPKRKWRRSFCMQTEAPVLRKAWFCSLFLPQEKKVTFLLSHCLLEKQPIRPGTNGCWEKTDSIIQQPLFSLMWTALSIDLCSSVVFLAPAWWISSLYDTALGRLPSSYE